MARYYAPYDPYGGSDTIGELIRQRGDIAARGAEASGNLWGNAFSNIGQQLGSGVSSYFQAKEEEKQKKQLTIQAQAVNDAIDRGDVKALFQILPPDKAAIVAKGIETHQPDAIKKYGDVMNVLKAGAQANRALPEGSREKGWQAQIQSYAQNGVLTPEQAQQYSTYDPDVETRIANWGEKPKDEKTPEGFTLGEGQVRYGPKGEIVAQGPAKVEKPEPAPSLQQVQVTGPDGQQMLANYNPKTGKYTDTEGKPIAGPKPKGGEEKPPTPDQQKVAGFYKRATAAENVIKGLEGAEKGKPGGLEFLTPDRMLPDDRKSYLQAQDDFTMAFLRRESMASISDAERKDVGKAYFPQPKDPPALVTQKAASRKLILDNLAAEAGGAIQSAPGASVTVTAPNGKVYTFPSQQQADAFKKNAGM